MAKAQVGTIKLRMTAVLPGFRELRIVNNGSPVLNVLQKGNSENINLCRTKAIHGLCITFIMPRADTLVMANSIESEFIDLHNSYVTHKRVRETPDRYEDHFFLDTALRPTPCALDITQVTDSLHPALAPTTSDSIESVDDFFSIFPSMSTTATSLNHPDAMNTALTSFYSRPLHCYRSRSFPAWTLRLIRLERPTLTLPRRSILAPTSPPRPAWINPIPWSRP